ncbi:MAG TPA: YceI family protein [Phycisphaerae bacterium]|nr:YceI family protein [Phycisphaerae bacterium]
MCFLFKALHNHLLTSPGRQVAAWRGVGVSALAILVITFAGAASIAASAPQGTTFTASSGNVTIKGTSTLHDWSAQGNTVSGNVTTSGEWTTTGPNPISLQSIQLTIPVYTLKSSEGGGMDSTMYGTLNASQHPTITYQLTKATLKPAPNGQNNVFVFDTTGNLTVNGVAQKTSLELAITHQDNTSLTISTSANLKMTDFGVQPPTAMLGIIKSGDAITVTATWQLTTSASDAGK